MSDSAGESFQGRTLSSTGFDGDDGRADEALVAALANSRDEVGLLQAVAQGRLLVPIVADPTEVESGAETGGLARESHTDMAAVTLVAPDGTRALPVFSSVDALADWDAAARPVPVTAQRAAQAAISEQCDVIVLDLADPASVVLRPSMVWALASHRDWLPAHQDPVVADAVAAAAERHPMVRAHQIGPGVHAPGTLQIVLELAPDLDPGTVEQIATQVGESLATDGEVRARIDAVAFTIR